MTLTDTQEALMEEWFGPEEDRHPSPMHSAVAVLFLVAMATILAGILILSVAWL